MILIISNDRPSRKKATSMPRDGLTSELKSGPFAFSTADLNELIKAVTCGSLQMVEGFVPTGTVTPGAGVTAPGVSELGVRTGDE